MAAGSSRCWREGSPSSVRPGVFVRAGLTVAVGLIALLAASASSEAAAAPKPVNLLAPSVSGYAARGHRLNAWRGTWWAARSYAYSWQLSRNDGLGWTRIARARGSSYTPSKADEGARIRVSVTAANSHRRTTVRSRAVGPIRASPPVNWSEPEIWGLPQAASSLRTLTIGSWLGAGNKLTYQWQRSRRQARWRNISGARRAKYMLTRADVGSRVRLVVVATNLDRSAAVASDATRRVAPGPPVNVAPPAAPSGVPVVSSTLTAQPGAWDPTGATILSVWLRCPPGAATVTAGCSAISIGPTYVLTPADLGYRIAVRVNATSAAATASANSQLTDAVTSAAVALGAVARPVPPSFLGVSIETDELARFEQNVPAFASLLRLLATGDGSAVPLRVGGQTADQTFFNGDGFSAPPNAIGIDRAYMQKLGQLARSVPLSVMFDLNLEARSPSIAAAVASEALKALPAGSLSALEVGNEPDLYHAGVVGNNWNPSDQQWASTYGPADYASDFGAYAAAVANAAPGIPMAGPSLDGMGSDWLGALTSADRPSLGLLTAHRYPFSACAAPGSPQYPSIAGQLSNQASARLAASVKNAVATAHQAGLPFRVDELGSATCTGIYGVSDTFATSLWASDVLFNLLAVGVDGVNVHSRFNSANTPIWGAGTPRVRPFFYGMVAFTRTLGPGAALLQTSVTGHLPTGLSLWAVQLQGSQMHVLVINKSSSAATVTLQADAQSSAQVRLLQSSSMAPGAQVTFGGQRLADDGTWQGTPVTSNLDVHNGGYRVSAPPLSASLLSFAAS